MILQKQKNPVSSYSLREYVKSENCKREMVMSYFGYSLLPLKGVWYLSFEWDCHPSCDIHKDTISATQKEGYFSLHTSLLEVIPWSQENLKLWMLAHAIP